MDFVVVGLGVGALAVLLGLTIRDGGDRWWPGRGTKPPSAAETGRRLAIGRACRAGGLVLAAAGGAILVVTMAALVLGVSDRVGAILVMSVVAAAILGGIAWAVLYTHRYHPRPRSRIAARRQEPSVEPAATEAPSLAGTIDAGVARLDAAPAADELAAEPTGEEESATVDDEPAPAPAPDPAAGERERDGVALAPETVDPAAPTEDEPATPEADRSSADGSPDGEAPARTRAYATSVNRGA